MLVDSGGTHGYHLSVVLSYFEFIGDCRLAVLFGGGREAFEHCSTQDYLCKIIGVQENSSFKGNQLLALSSLNKNGDRSSDKPELTLHHPPISPHQIPRQNPHTHLRQCIIHNIHILRRRRLLLRQRRRLHRHRYISFSINEQSRQGQ